MEVVDPSSLQASAIVEVPATLASQVTARVSASA